MERIESILLRIQGIYYDKREKTNIDIDLMLDYTRVLYADLLEWKKNVPNIEVLAQEAPKQTPEIQETNPEHQERSTETIQNEETQDAATPIVEPEINEEATETENYPLEIPAVIPAEIKQEEGTENKYLQEIKMDEPLAEDIVYEPAEAPEVPEKTPDDFIYRDRAVLSFELPKADEESEIPHTERADEDVQRNLMEPEPEIEKDLEDEEAIETKAPETQRPGIKEEIKAIPNSSKFESFEIPHSDYSGLFAAMQPKVTRDLRKNIGLNDRYLFLNELFGNNKNEYETCLNQLNEISDLNNARQYLDTIAKKNNWSQDDTTVESFYNVLSKHFSDK